MLPSPSAKIPVPRGYTTEQIPRDDPYSYTSGRWLNRDELERKSRYIHFDFQALCERAIELCPGATRIVEHEKKEGGFNKVFIFIMDTGSQAVARLPTGIAGPARLTTNSEVATITYLQSKLALPIPKILDWKDTSSKPIGTEYIIQEHAKGVQLHYKWLEMNLEQHMLCTSALSLMIKKMASLDFPAYGSLYFSDAPIEASKKIPFDQGHGQGFCIGPHCGPIYWNQCPGEPELYGSPSPNCGPWDDLTSYSAGLIETGTSRLPKKEDTVSSKRPYQGSIEEHIHLLKSSQEVMEKLITDKRIQNAASPVLIHADFHMKNIYVSAEDPTIITGIIDWQSTSIEPAFLYQRQSPEFAALPAPSQTEILGQETEDTSQTESDRKDVSICNQPTT